MLSGLIDTVNITVLVAGPYGWWLLVHMDGGTCQYKRYWLLVHMDGGCWSIWMVALINIMVLVTGPYGCWLLVHMGGGTYQ